MESKKKNSNIDNKNKIINNKNSTNNKNKINININNNKEEEDDNIIFIKNIPKKNTVYIPSSQVPTLSLDYKIPGFSKIQKDDKAKIKKPLQNIIMNLKSLDDQWSFQKILLDYNILDFTSK